jgi:hypothetical protein
MLTVRRQKPKTTLFARGAQPALRRTPVHWPAEMTEGHFSR